MSETIEILYGAKAKITSKTGNSISDRIHFEAESDIPIKDDTINLLQMNLGYHPAGYGLFGVFKFERDGKHYAKWQCSACCD